MTFNKRIRGRPPLPTVLVIRNDPAPVTTSDCIIASPEALDWALIARHEPGLILSPLMMGRLDVLDIALMLAGLEYRGKYRVVTCALPRPDVVNRDVLRATPALDFGIWRPDRPDFAAQDCPFVDRSVLRKFAALAQ